MTSHSKHVNGADLVEVTKQRLADYPDCQERKKVEMFLEQMESKYGKNKNE